MQKLTTMADYDSDFAKALEILSDDVGFYACIGEMKDHGINELKNALHEEWCPGLRIEQWASHAFFRLKDSFEDDGEYL